MSPYPLHVHNCRACRLCGASAVNPTDGGFAEHPSPWALWMGALDADLVVVGQDFASQEQPHVRPDPTLRTNVNLLRLITSPRAAGIDPSRVYLTNAVLCLKPGPMSARVPAAWIDNCSTHLRRTIEIVNPFAVAALGSVAWRAVCRAFALPMVKFATSVGAAPLTPPAGAPALFAFAHCGALGTARRPIDRQEQDWARMGQWIAPRPRRAA